MQKGYRHLRKEDRDVIYRMKQQAKSQAEIAGTIGFAESTVSRELKRNRGLRGYRPKQAQEKAAKRKEEKGLRGTVVSGEVAEAVRERLSRKHCPEQISGSLEREGILVSHETIYGYIRRDRASGGELWRNLRINGKRRYRRRAGTRRHGRIPDRRGIETRPRVVEERLRHGDWEADLIEGTKGSGFLLSLYERKTRTGKLLRLDTKTARETADGIVSVLSGYRVKTITYDNGLEFSLHGEIEEELGARGYFCAPYHSWEKGGVENFNGLVRQYYPKGASFEGITAEDLQRVEDEINERPRKILDYKSPSELKQKIAA